MIKLVKAVVYFVICKLLYRVKYINKDNEEKLDKCIICPNHFKWADPAYVYTVTDNIAVMAKAELFKFKIVANFFEHLNVFPIKRGEKDAKALLHAINLFKKDKQKLLLFPEGTRVKGKVDIVEAKIGAAYIAMKADVPVIPVFISRKNMIFSKINIIYGEPMYLDKTKIKDKEYLQEVSNQILKKSYELAISYGEKI